MATKRIFSFSFMGETKMRRKACFLVPEGPRGTSYLIRPLAQLIQRKYVHDPSTYYNGPKEKNGFFSFPRRITTFFCEEMVSQTH